MQLEKQSIKSVYYSSHSARSRFYKAKETTFLEKLLIIAPPAAIVLYSLASRSIAGGVNAQGIEAVGTPKATQVKIDKECRMGR